MDEKETRNISSDSLEQRTLTDDPGALQAIPTAHLPPATNEPQDGAGLATRISSVPFEAHYIEGWALFSVIGSVTVASFLVLLDTSIIATVCIMSRDEWFYIYHPFTN